MVAEEDNLLAVRRLALARGWLNYAGYAMQGLRTLYDASGWRSEWQALVEEIVPVFVDPATDLPQQGVDEQIWEMVTEYRSDLAYEARRWKEAEHLGQLLVELTRCWAADALAVPQEKLGESERNTIRALAVAIQRLADIQYELSETACIASYEEAVDLMQRIGNRTGEASIAINLGNAYFELPAIRNLDRADKWYQCAFGLFSVGDYARRGKSLIALGNVAYKRFSVEKAAGALEEVYLKHWKCAVDYYRQALALFPEYAVEDLAMAHGSIGNVYSDAGQIDMARTHYDSTIGLYEQAGNIYSAAQGRHNMAGLLGRAGQLSDALYYAKAALRGYQSVANAEDRIQDVQRMIDQISKPCKKETNHD